MKNKYIILTVFLGITNFSIAQQLSNKIDSIIRDSYEKNPNIAFSLGFIHNGEEHYSSYGTISRESDTPINKNSIFEIASITKILTANMIAQAALEHKLKINDYIDAYLPKEYILQDSLKNKISIADLASHQSGLPDIDFGKLIELNPQQPVSSVNLETLTSLINNTTELTDYGTYRYSTVGYILMGHILERVYGKSYDTIIQEKLLAPAQMNQTLTKDFKVTNKTVGYNPEGGTQAFFEWNITAPAGLVKSNAKDMVNYLNTVLGTENDIAKAALLTEKTFYAKEGRTYGLGLTIIADGDTTIYLKTGDSMGQSSILAYDRKEKWGIVILMNQRNHQLRQQLFNVVYETVSDHMNR